MILEVIGYFRDLLILLGQEWYLGVFFFSVWVIVGVQIFVNY